MEMFRVKTPRDIAFPRIRNHATSRVVLGLSVLLPFGASLLYVHLFGVNVFFADEWDFVPILQKQQRGALSVADLFVHHNEHIYFFPWTVMLLLGAVTRYNTVPLMYLTQVCLLATSVGLFLAFRKTFTLRSPLTALSFIPVPFLVFSFRQSENMLWGNQITFAFAQTFAVLALYFILASETKSYRKPIFSAALVSATIASFSAVQGLLVWPAGFVQLLVAPIERPAKRLLVGLWGMVGLGEWIVYFIGYSKPRGVPPLSHILAHPAAGMDYFLTLLGSSLFWQESSAFSGGLLLTCLTVANLLLVYRDEELKQNSFWISLLLFSFLSLALITVGRASFEDEQVFAQPLASRYTTFSVLGAVSVYVMLAKVAWDRRSHIITALFGALLGFVILSIPTSYLQGVEAGTTIESYREVAAATLSTFESQPDRALLISLEHKPAHVREYAPFLRENDYNVFAD
jgi:hypothetical protein